MYNDFFKPKLDTVYEDDLLEITKPEKSGKEKIKEALNYTFIEKKAIYPALAEVGLHLGGMVTHAYDVPHYDVLTHIFGVATVRYGIGKFGEYLWPDIEEKAGKYLTLGAIAVSGVTMEGLEYLFRYPSSLGDGSVSNTIKDVAISNPIGAVIAHALIKKKII